MPMLTYDTYGNGIVAIRHYLQFHYAAAPPMSLITAIFI